MNKKTGPPSPPYKDVIYGRQIKKRQRVRTHLKRFEGVMHLSRRSQRLQAQNEPVHLTVTTSGERPFKSVVCWYSVDGETKKRVLFNKGAVEWDDVAWSYVRYWHALIPPVSDGHELVYRIGAELADNSDDWVYADNQVTTFEDATLFSTLVDNHRPPAWASSALIYHIFVDRFNPGVGKEWLPAESLLDYFGGTIKGITEKLDYLDGMGFNTIWLSPVFASPTHHGYDATDLLNVEPRFGTNEDLDDLIHAAHARGIRVILDFVPNHWSNQHPTFLDAQKNEDSQYHDWYIWNRWPDNYESYFGLQGMPKLNLHAGSPARTHLMDVARHWLRKGVDGFRLDHANGPARDFWTEFRLVCRSEKPDAWLFGEIVRPPNVLQSYAGGMHGCLDFALTQALRQTFALENWSMGRFEAFLADHLDYLPSGYTAPSFIDNHDMNRFYFICGEDKRKVMLAALVLYALPGAPIVYYGTERGISQGSSTSSIVGLDEARQPIIWSDNPDEELLSYFRRLAKARERIDFARNPSREVIFLDSDKHLYAFAWIVDDEVIAVIALNGSKTTNKVEIPSPHPLNGKDILNNQAIATQGNSLTIVLAPMSGAFISAGEENK